MKSAKLKKSRLESRVAAERFDAKSSLLVQSRTLGTAMDYDFATFNMSRTGLFLRANASNVPFRVPTILEMTVDPQSEYFEEPVTLVTKVVRRVDHEDGSCDIGVMIIPECSDIDTWNQWMDFVEQNISGLFDKSTVTRQVKKFRHKRNGASHPAA